MDSYQHTSNLVALEIMIFSSICYVNIRKLKKKLMQNKFCKLTVEFPSTEEFYKETDLDQMNEMISVWVTN